MPVNNTESNAYILGTEWEELHRLGLQHQVWDAEARTAWQTAEFSRGQTILDLGCGPGFCTRDLAYITGNEGKVIGVDKSAHFIDMLQAIADLHKLNIEAIHADFTELDLEDESLDGCFARWALAWLSDPEPTIEKVIDALKPGGVFIAQEYYDWSLFQTEPQTPHLKKAIAAALSSFKTMDGDIDIGRKLPKIFFDMGLEVISMRPMSKLANPNDLSWHWPKSFLHIYLPKVRHMGLLDQTTVENALAELDELECDGESTIMCPQMVEVIGVKM